MLTLLPASYRPSSLSTSDTILFVMTDKKRGQGKTQSIGGLSPSLPRSLRGGLRVGLLTLALPYANRCANELPRSPKRTLLRILSETASEPMFELLLAAAAIYLVLGYRAEALMLRESAIITVAKVVFQENRSKAGYPINVQIS